MISPLSANQTNPLRLTTNAMVGERNLQRRIDGLRARVGKKHMIEVAGTKLDKATCQIKGSRMTELEIRRIVELGGLSSNCLNYRLPTMTGIHAPESRGSIQNVAAVR
jgi:hypothetical protein